MLFRSEAAADPRFATNDGRVRHYDVLQPVVAAVIAGRTLAAWLDGLREAGVPAGAVRDIDAVLADAQVRARDMITRLSHPALGPLDVLGVPVKLSDTPGAVRTAPPTLGQHTQAVLSGDLGLSGEAISRLRASGVVK